MIGRGVRKGVDRNADWPTAQLSDPVTGEIYQLVASGSPRPLAESTTDRSVEFKILAAQYERLKIVDGILYRESHDNNTGASYSQIIVPGPLRREIADQESKRRPPGSSSVQAPPPETVLLARPTHRRPSS